ncbi:hypothetical protein LBBP_02766 [Leptospira borgpetersenii serovar Ballum]|uniref:Uncharacterized protein n=1 Tax=Leptospira borgpetersenii serovar Ballum TaxID=280505 RepID=A0A0S2ITK7_LEPBO|nr:hypothetical protein LBBP_02766 [Leptospira borgpetersenii serovar Ballum]
MTRFKLWKLPAHKTQNEKWGFECLSENFSHFRNYLENFLE